MHAITQTLAHRAQAPATRARARCHPHYYLPAPLAATARSAPSTPAYLTPSSSSSSSIPTPCLRQQAAPPPHAGPSSHTVTAPTLPQRNRFASALVDLAVNTLCDIWPTSIIPVVFVSDSPPRVRSEHASGPFAAPVPAHPPAPAQLPSPPSSPGNSALGAFDDDSTSTAASMRGFVIEVLRRSRTSTNVLQTALCYLEAIQPKVCELAAHERDGTGLRGEEDQGARLVLASDPAAHEPEADIEELLDPSSFDAEAGRACDSVPTESMPLDTAMPPTPCQSSKKPRTDPASLPPLPSLPSPLLDPRRAFIAALVLASKFAQDKCYSNRAWAKLAALPPREIGRCERALGDALGWRLWVGKKPCSQGARASLCRAKSDGSVLSERSREPTPLGAPGCDRALRRSSTLPAAAFQPGAPMLAAAPPLVPAPYLKPPATCAALPFAATMQGPWMPVMQSPPMATGPWLEPTPQLSASPATTESSVDEQCTVQLSDLPEMPTLGGIVEAKGAPLYALPLQSSVGSFGSEGGIVALGWNASQEYSWGIPA